MQRDVALFATPEVGRIFLACQTCGRTVPHYRVYGRVGATKTSGRCACGATMYRPIVLPAWKAAWWLLVVGWVWRKTMRREPEWDPRMPIRMQEVRDTAAWEGRA